MKSSDFCDIAAAVAVLIVGWIAVNLSVTVMNAFMTLNQVEVRLRVLEHELKSHTSDELVDSLDIESRPELLNTPKRKLVKVTARKVTVKVRPKVKAIDPQLTDELLFKSPDHQ